MCQCTRNLQRQEHGAILQFLLNHQNDFCRGLEAAHILHLLFMFMMETKKRKAGDENRVFNLAFLRKFVFAEMHGKPMCLVCQKNNCCANTSESATPHEQLYPEFKAVYPLDNDLQRKTPNIARLVLSPTAHFPQYSQEQ